MNRSTATKTALLACVWISTAASARAQDWPQWRGLNRDNHVTGFAEPKTWPKELTQKWKVNVGIGESSPVLMGDKLYVFGRKGDDEVTLCLDAATGKEVWSYKYMADSVGGPAAKHPGTRSTPAVGEGKVCTLGVAGVITCLDALSGKKIWEKKKAMPKYYTSTSPIIVDGKCVVFAGALTAYDLATGEEKWSWSEAEAPYGSPVLLTAGRVKQVVTPAMGALVGVNLADGKLLWKTKLGSAYQSTYSTPVIDGTTVIYSEPGGKGKGGGGGTVALKIESDSGVFIAKEVWKKPLAASGYHTPVLKGDLLFGVASDRTFFCLNAKTGDTLWTDKSKQGECGSILDTGHVLLALSSDQQLIAFEPSSQQFKEVAKYRVGDGETWSVPIVAGSRIYVKDVKGSLSLLTID
jgi:outer membrane protein assembly factor BamB